MRDFRVARCTLLTWLMLFMLGACGGGGNGSTPATSTDTDTAQVQSISLAAPAGSTASNTAAVGTKFQIQGTAIYADGSKHDLTEAMSWSSSNTAVATVDSKGLVTPVSPGTTIISATVNGVTASFTLTVTGATLTSIGVTPAIQSTPAGLTQQLTATGVYDDGTTQDLTATATWASDTPSVATVSSTPGSAGLATAVSTGSSNITAVVNGVTGSTAFNVSPATLVSLTVTAPSPNLAKGTQVHLTVTGTYSDGTTQDLTGAVAWTSSDSSVVSIGTTGANAGLLTAVNTGNATVTSTLNGVSSSTQITATPATLVSIAVTPFLANVALGNTLQLTATGTYSDNTTQDLTSSALWSSSAAGVATVSNSLGHEGLTAPVALGTSTITATSGSVAGTVGLNVTPAVLQSIAVTPTAATIAAGLADQVVAVGTYSDNTTQDLTTTATWTTSDGTVASISNAAGSQGLLSALVAGPVSVTASVGSISNSANVTVSPATVSSLVVAPATSTVAAGSTQQLTATGTLTNLLTLDVTLTSSWTSSNPAVATVSSTGLVTGVAAGTATLTATLLTGQTGTATVTVNSVTLTSIVLTPNNPTVTLLTTQQLTATGTFSDGSTSDLTSSTTFTSNNPLVAAVSNAPGSQGLVTGLLPGTAVITATKGTTTATVTVTVATVTLPVLSSITITPTNTNLVGSVLSLLGTNTQFTATGNYSDGSTQNLTSTATWSTSQPGAATVNSQGQMQLTLGGLLGLVGLGANTVNVSATSGGVTGTTQVSLTVL